MINNKYLTQIEEKLDLYFGQKAPAMPENIKELIVKYSPYLILIMMVLSLPALLFALGLGSIIMPFAFAGAYHPGFSISIIISLVAMVLEVMALPGLFKRTKNSWELMFYSSLLMIVSYILDFNIGSLIIGGAISFYILFQIKSYYKN